MSIFIFIVLIYSTYLSDSFSRFEAPFYQNNKNGEFTLDLDEEGLTKEYINSEDSIKIEYLNSFDKIISYKGDFSYAKKDGTKKITLGDGVYLISITELSSEYEINLNGIKFKNNGPTNIYYDARDENRKVIFSLNNTIKLEMLDESGNISNNVYLYPHMYLKYNPGYISEVKNSDILRIKQWFTLDYFGGPIISNEKIDENFIKKLIGEQDQEKIKTFFKYIQKKYKDETRILDNFKEKNFGTIIGESLIKRYNDLFLNETKKTIYYKNLAIRYLGDIVNSKEIEKKKNKEIIDIVKKIKKYSQKDYEEIKEILDYYTTIIVNGNKESLNKKINLSNIHNNLDGSGGYFTEYGVLDINSIFFSYDFLNNDDIYKDIFEYLIDVDIENFDENKKSYLILFLNNKISHGLEGIINNKNYDISNIIKLFNIYTRTSLDYYDVENDDTRILTGLKEYLDILNKTSQTIRKSFFDKDENGLLILKDNYSLNKEEINKIEKDINKLMSYYIKNKNNIKSSPRNKNLKNSFEKKLDEFKMYFLAIKDYNTYLVNYDQTNKNIFGSETLKQLGENNFELSEDKAKEFINQFEGIDDSKTKISIQNFDYCNNPSNEYKNSMEGEPECYLFEDLIIHYSDYSDTKNNISFTLNPYRFNTIENFIINGDKNKNKGSYILDNIKEELQEKLKSTEDPREAKKYKFENFFINNFIEKEYERKDEENIKEENEKIANESTIIQVFKRSKLLGQNGDFSLLDKFIKISYNDIIVNDNNTNNEERYDINIDGAPFSVDVDKQKYYGSLFGKYRFLPDHSFINPQLLYKNEAGDELIYGNKIELIKVVPINELKTTITEFSKLNNIPKYIINSLNNTFYQSMFDIKYNFENDTFYIENDNFYIVVESGRLRRLDYKNIENYTNLNIEFKNIDNFLKVIKK